MGGGPQVAANVQAGKTNTQTIGTTTNVEAKGASQKVSGSTKVQAEGVGTVNNYEASPELIGALVGLFILWSYLLWKLPSPDQIWKPRNK